MFDNTIRCRRTGVHITTTRFEVNGQTTENVTMQMADPRLELKVVEEKDAGVDPRNSGSFNKADLWRGRC